MILYTMERSAESVDPGCNALRYLIKSVDISKQLEYTIYS